MRISTLIIVPIFLISILVVVPSFAQGSSNDDVKIRLNVELIGKGEGRLQFSIDAGTMSEPNWNDSFPRNIAPYTNDNMDRVLRSIRKGGIGEERILGSIFRNDGDLKELETTVSYMSERNYFGFRFTANFTYDVTGIDAEYNYLDFVYYVDEMFGSSGGGVDGLMNELKREREMRRIKIDIRISGDYGLSYTTSTTVSDHNRDLTSENIAERTDAQQFIRNSNEVKVFESSLLAPITIFISLIVILLIGYSILVFLWVKEKYRGVALILPIITAVFPIFMVATYLFPGISLYNLGGGTIWLQGAIFLLLVGVCNLFNPRFKYGSFEEERVDQPSVKMPDVIYVNKRVFVERPVRITEEQAMDPYEVLDLKHKATWEEIDKAYRSKVKEYHPDKFIGTPSRIHKAAKEETERLNMAYDKLKRKFGK